MSSTFYLDRSSPIHRLNPVTKLVALLSLLVIVFALPVWWVAATIVLVIIVPAAIVSRCGRTLTKVSLVILVPLVIALVLVQGLTFPGGRTAVLQWGFVTVTAEGLLFALGIGSRIICLVLLSILLVLTTHPGHLTTALSERGVSPSFSYIIASTLQLLPAFRDRAKGILLAQQARGLAFSKNPLNRIKLMLPLIGPLILSMFTDVEERSTAMEARGFGSKVKRTIFTPIPDSTLQRITRWVMLAMALGSIPLGIITGVL